MLVYIDARDLINVFNLGRPLSVSELASRMAGHELAVPYSLIVELVPRDRQPIVVQNRMVNLEERFHLRFLRLRDFAQDEVRMAFAAFTGGTEPEPYQVEVSSFMDAIDDRERETLFSRLLKMETDRTVGLRRLVTQVEMLLTNPALFQWSARERSIAEHVLDSTRRNIADGVKSKTIFEQDVSEATREIGLSPEMLHDFAQWLRSRPRVAPGWRLFREVLEQMARDTNYRATTNDVYDLAHVSFIPYVDFATLDGNKADAVRKASHRLRQFDEAIDYDRRVFAGIEELLTKLESFSH